MNCIKTRGTYTFSGSFFDCDVLYVEQQGVPINSTNIDFLVQHHYPEPTETGHLTVIVAIDGEDDDLEKAKGSWKPISAEEDRFAIVRAIHRDINNDRIEEKSLKKYNTLLRATTITVEKFLWRKRVSTGLSTYARRSARQGGLPELHSSACMKLC